MAALHGRSYEMGLGRVEPHEPTPIVTGARNGGDPPPPGHSGLTGTEQIVLLQTKLVPPRTAQFNRLLRRPRLTELMRTALDQRLILVSAPAGYGKTTLVLQSLEDTGSDRTIAWFSIDERDNDPSRFIAYLVGALQRSLSTPEKVALTTVSTGSSSPENELEHILNRVSRADHQIVLVVDDYHRITNPAIHGLMDYLIEFIPMTLRLVIIARFDPPLPIARWRSHGELTEIRIDDLSFTEPEIADYFAIGTGDRSQQRLVARIHERTDGWAFALNSLKSLAHGSAPERDNDLLAGFVGNRRDLADFLVEEILRKMPGDRRTFLLKTSILTRMFGSLCDAVTGESNGQTMLQSLENDGLPIFALDDRRTSYRYHQLLADLLKEQLGNEIGSDGVVELHRRASLYLEEHHQIDEAIQHTIAAGDWDRTVQLMIQIGLDLATFRNTLTMRRWLETFPEEYIGQNASLAFWMGQSLSSTCQPHRARQYLDRAERRWLELGETEQQGQVQVARAWCSILEGKLDESLALTEQALDLSADADAAAQSASRLVRGVALSRAGHVNEATAVFDLVDEQKSLPRVLSVERGRLAMLAGRFDEAEDRLGVGIANDNLTDLVRRGHIWLAEIALARGEFDLAEAQIGWADEVALQLDTRMILPLVEIPRARLLWARHEQTRALELLQSAIDAAKVDEIPAAVFFCESVRAGFWLEQHRNEEVAAWLAIPRSGSRVNDYAQFERDLVEVRFRAATDDVAGALLLCVRLRETAAKDGRVVDVARLLLRESQVMLAGGRREEALDRLRSALELLGPGRGIRFVVDEGLALTGLLATIASSGNHLEFITAFMQHAGETDRDAVGTGDQVVESLSGRELEVLRLVSIGLSNREIADELFISVPTVKRHLSTVFEKLGVTNRTQAASLARTLGKV